jgi:hypothetical protein
MAPPRLRGLPAALVAALSLSAPAAARELRILAALPDIPEPGQLSIRVRGYPLGTTRAHVCLGESTVPLETTLETATEIRAALPAGIPTGTYRLTLRAVLAAGTASCPDRAPAESSSFAAFDLALSDPSSLEIQHALCDGETPNPRPGICPGRCTCAPPSFGHDCTLTASDGEVRFVFTKVVRDAKCRFRFDGARCADSSEKACVQDADCTGGQQCVQVPGTANAVCRYPCVTDADCHETAPEVTRYLGVGAPESRNVVTCERPTLPSLPISNNDALACIAFLEAGCAP